MDDEDDEGEDKVVFNDDDASAGYDDTGCSTFTSACSIHSPLLDLSFFFFCPMLISCGCCNDEEIESDDNGDEAEDDKAMDGDRELERRMRTDFGERKHKEDTEGRGGCSITDGNFDD
jgi:hypothetical protein